MFEMPSITVRIILFVVLLTIYLVHRSGYFKKRKERLANEQQAVEKAKRRQERKERARKTRELREREEQRTAEILQLATPGLSLRSANAAGLDVYYLEGGARNENPSIVLLHGFASEKEAWAPLANNLVQVGWHVIAPDLAGFGQSSRDDSLSYDVTTQAKRVRTFVHKLGLPPVHLVGCAMGGTIAAAYAYGSTQEVTSLTLIEPFGVRVPYPSELDEHLARGANPLLIANPQAYGGLRSFLYAQPPEIRPEIAKLFAERLANGRAFYAKVWQEVREGDRAFLLDLLVPELRVRTLVLLGGASRVLHGATAEVIQNMNPTYLTTAVVPDAGHFLMVEKPNESAQHLVEFLDLVARAPSPV